MDDLAPDLIVTAEGPVRLIELNRPEQRNAASEALHTALADIWDRIAADDRVRAVVLTGRGRAFSAGGDFHVMTRSSRTRRSGSRTSWKHAASSPAWCADRCR
jgi:enoyl-CoA hydratase/carnithine racemase